MKKKNTIYINGIKASKEDIKIFIKDITKGKTTAKAHTTKKGNFAIVTSC